MVASRKLPFRVAGMEKLRKESSSYQMTPLVALGAVTLSSWPEAPAETVAPSAGSGLETVGGPATVKERLPVAGWRVVPLEFSWQVGVGVPLVGDEVAAPGPGVGPEDAEVGAHVAELPVPRRGLPLHLRRQLPYIVDLVADIDDKELRVGHTRRSQRAAEHQRAKREPEPERPCAHLNPHNQPARSTATAGISSSFPRWQRRDSTVPSCSFRQRTSGTCPEKT